MAQITLLAVCGAVLLLAGLTHCTDEQREKRLGDNDFFQATYNENQSRQRQRELQRYFDKQMQSVGKRGGNVEDLYQLEGLDRDFIRRLVAKYYSEMIRRR